MQEILDFLEPFVPFIHPVCTVINLATKCWPQKSKCPDCQNKRKNQAKD